MVLALLQLALLGWLPGAVLYRLPFRHRDRRAALEPEERLFWQVIISVAVSLAIALLLAAAGWYTLERLLAADAALALSAAAAGRFRLRLGAAARRPGPAAVLPLVLIVLGVWRAHPPFEYVIGGKDPGVYFNEGIRIAQRGTLVHEDPVIAAVPPFARDLFFPSHERDDYYSVRFMGFWIQNPDAGTVVTQFPQLFPASIAVGYGVHGLTGGRLVPLVGGVLGLLAVYFTARRLVGTLPAFAASTLLALHLVQVWFSRYPNAEIVMQPLLFAAILASARAHDGEDGFFAPIAGLLLGLLVFLRFDAVLGIAGVGIALIMAAASGRRIRASLLLVLAGALLLALPYYLGPLRGYSYLPLVFLRNLYGWQYAGLAAAAALLVGCIAASRRWPAAGRKVAGLFPLALAAALAIGAVYALYFREPAGKLAVHDAYALRTFTYSYLTLPALIAALAGFAVAARRAFWRTPELFTTVALFAFFFFYKIRIVPEHFWMARRFLPVLLPGAMIFVAAIALTGLEGRSRVRQALRTALGVLFLVLLGSRYASMTAPVVDHVEYAGIIPKLEALAAHISEDDLVIVESRDASDIHVLALPLAYIYARNVLVLNTPVPDRQDFESFLEWADSHYQRVLFLASGGTDALTGRWSAAPLEQDRFTVPEYQVTPFVAFPRGAGLRKIDYRLYTFVPLRPAEPFDLDVGRWDDLYLVRFHSVEESDGRSMRWTGRTSYVSVPSIPAEAREVTIWMSDGGRPSSVEPAEVELYLEDHLLGRATVGPGFRPYAFAIPAAVAAEAAGGSLARLRLVSTLWSPHEALGTGDDRQLGVMVDRIQVE